MNYFKKITLSTLFFSVSFFFYVQKNNYEICSYETNGKGKSAGLKIKIKYPCNWKTREGERPGVISVFSNGSGLIITFSINKIPLTIKPLERKKLVTKEGVRAALEDYTIDSLREVIIDKLPAGEAVYHYESERTFGQIYSKALHYSIVYKDYYITLEYASAGLKSKQSSIDSLFKTYELGFRGLASQTIILSQYE